MGELAVPIHRAREVTGFTQDDAGVDVELSDGQHLRSEYLVGCVLLNFDEPGGVDIAPWADRVQSIDATHVDRWELPAIGAVTAHTAVLVRPDGYVAWVGDWAQGGAR